MSTWIKHNEKTPNLRQHILATLVDHGSPKVVACWYIDDNRIMIDETPNSQTYSFSMVKAWQPFPQPYSESA